MTDDARGGAIDPRIDRAVELIRSLPLRWSDDDRGSPEEVVLARGWFRGGEECARVLAAQAPLEACRGGGFGTNWPILTGGAGIVAPALPVVIANTAGGPDGEYRRDDLGVWREAGGAEGLYLTANSAHPAPGVPFDLLWFGDLERFIMREGTLEIEDLFGTLRIPASPQHIDRLLVRSRRVDREILSSLPTIDDGRPQTIEVRRPLALSEDRRWRDAVRFLAARADVERAKQHGGGVEVQVVGGATVFFGLEEGPGGWTLTRQDGSYVFTKIRLDRSAMTLGVSATLDGRIDAMEPGMRGRLIFDLRADLVTLG